MLKIARKINRNVDFPSFSKSFMHRLIVLCRLFIRYVNILQYIRINLQRCCQFAHRLLFSQHDFHHFLTRQDTVTRASILGEDDMTALLPADTTAVLCHVLIDILVAHSGLGIVDALFVKSFIQTKVGHNGRDHSVSQQLPTFFHIAAVDVQDMVASNNISFLIHAQAAVSIAVISKTNIQALFHNKLLQSLNMGRTRVQVNVQTVWLVIDNIGICAESIKDRFCNVPRTAISADPLSM